MCRVCEQLGFTLLQVLLLCFAVNLGCYEARTKFGGARSCFAPTCHSVSFPTMPYRAECPQPRRLLGFTSSKPLHGTDRGMGLPQSTPHQPGSQTGWCTWTSPSQTCHAAPCASPVSLPSTGFRSGGRGRCYAFPTVSSLLINNRVIMCTSPQGNCTVRELQLFSSQELGLGPRRKDQPRKHHKTKQNASDRLITCSSPEGCPRNSVLGGQLIS